MKLIPEDANILMSVDLDEFFDPGWADVVRQEWNPEIHRRGYYQMAWSLTDTGAPTNIFTYDKIHDRSYYWIYGVHEVLWSDTPIEENQILRLGNKIKMYHN